MHDDVAHLIMWIFTCLFFIITWIQLASIQSDVKDLKKQMDKVIPIEQINKEAK